MRARGLAGLADLSRSVLRALTVPRCAVVSFSSCLSIFFCRFRALRSVSSRRSTVRNTFCAAATLAARGVAADRLLLAARLAAPGVELSGRLLAEFFFVDLRAAALSG
jgi:hypothetical protein